MNLLDAEATRARKKAGHVLVATPTIRRGHPVQWAYVVRPDPRRGRR